MVSFLGFPWRAVRGLKPGPAGRVSAGPPSTAWNHMPCIPRGHHLPALAPKPRLPCWRASTGSAGPIAVTFAAGRLHAGVLVECAQISWRYPPDVRGRTHLPPRLPPARQRLCAMCLVHARMVGAESAPTASTLLIRAELHPTVTGACFAM